MSFWLIFYWWYYLRPNHILFLDHICKRKKINVSMDKSKVLPEGPWWENNKWIKKNMKGTKSFSTLKVSFVTILLTILVSLHFKMSVRDETSSNVVVSLRAVCSLTLITVIPEKRLQFPSKCWQDLHELHEFWFKNIGGVVRNWR